MQDEPMVRVAPKRRRHDFLKLRLDLVDISARSEVSPVADPENMRVHRKGFFAERGV
jgi:hypothetical protein